MPDKQLTTYTKLYDMVDELNLYNQDGPLSFKEVLEDMMDFEMAERNTWKLKWSSHGSSGLPCSLQCEDHKIYYVIMFLSVITNDLILNKNVYYATLFFCYSN